MNKKDIRILTITIIIAIVFVMVGIVALQFFLTTAPQPNPLDVKNVSEGGVPTSSPQEAEQNKKSFQVGLLINQLPYKDQYFSLSYNDANSTFSLYIDPSHKQEGNAQLDTFLKKNGVENQSWLQNLSTTYAKPK